DEPQMRQHQLPGGTQVATKAQALCELTFFFTAQDWNSANSVQVSVQASQRTGQREVAIAGDQCGTCGHEISHLLGGHFSTRGIGVLRATKVPQHLFRSRLQFALSDNRLHLSNPSAHPSYERGNGPR